ncbi:hypothetical protein IW262DRAFT_644 [Armillaria fumosa]|nr:hypothetical protein IW262DRAFT_644 [Armillaria fumosa]
MVQEEIATLYAQHSQSPLISIFVYRSTKSPNGLSELAIGRCSFFAGPPARRRSVSYLCGMKKTYVACLKWEVGVCCGYGNALRSRFKDLRDTQLPSFENSICMVMTAVIGDFIGGSMECSSVFPLYSRPCTGSLFTLSAFFRPEIRRQHRPVALRKGLTHWYPCTMLTVSSSVFIGENLHSGFEPDRHSFGTGHSWLNAPELRDLVLGSFVLSYLTDIGHLHRD